LLQSIFWSQKSSDGHEKRSPASQERRKSIEISYEAKYCNSDINDLIEIPTHFDVDAHPWHTLLRPAIGKKDAEEKRNDRNCGLPGTERRNRKKRINERKTHL
jgi:hypothetical protein